MGVTRATGSDFVAGSDDADENRAARETSTRQQGPAPVTAPENRYGRQHPTNWGQHPINIRLSIRTLLNRYYIVVLAGPECRGEARRSEERKRHPFFIRNNLWFTGILIGMVVYFMAISGGLGVGLYLAFKLLGYR